MDVEKVDRKGVRWVTEGVLYTKEVIAKDDERKAIILWIDQQAKICAMDIEQIESENENKTCIALRSCLKTFEDVRTFIKRRGVD